MQQKVFVLYSTITTLGQTNSLVYSIRIRWKIHSLVLNLLWVSDEFLELPEFEDNKIFLFRLTVVDIITWLIKYVFVVEQLSKSY